MILCTLNNEAFCILLTYSEILTLQTQFEIYSISPIYITRVHDYIIQKLHFTKTFVIIKNKIFIMNIMNRLALMSYDYDCHRLVPNKIIQFIDCRINGKNVSNNMIHYAILCKNRIRFFINQLLINGFDNVSEIFSFSKLE